MFILSYILALQERQGGFARLLWDRVAGGYKIFRTQLWRNFSSYPVSIFSCIRSHIVLNASLMTCDGSSAAKASVCRQRAPNLINWMFWPMDRMQDMELLFHTGVSRKQHFKDCSKIIKIDSTGKSFFKAMNSYHLHYVCNWNLQRGYFLEDLRWWRHSKGQSLPMCA